MEELWKHFKLLEVEKGITAVEASKVAISKQHAQFSILFKLQVLKISTRKLLKPLVRIFGVLLKV